MSSVNKVILIGNMGDVPQVYKKGNNKPFAMVQLATNKKWKKEGIKQQRTDWHSIMLTGSSLTFAEQYLGKGDEIYIEGEQRTRTYLDSAGNKRFQTYVRAYDLRPMRTKQKSVVEAEAVTETSAAEEEIDEASMKGDVPF